MRKLKHNAVKRTLILLSMLFVNALILSAGEDYTRKVFLASDGDSLLYRVLEPQNPERGKKYPLVLFLHGAGERGNDNQSQLIHGSQMFLNPVNREKHPAFVLFPQCPSDDYWSFSKRPDSFEIMPEEEIMPPIIKNLKELLDHYLANPMIDKSRIYIMGLSMGGMATYDMVSRFPEIFAAAIPICGAVKAGRLEAAKDVKFRIYHGDADSVVPVECSRRAYRELKAAGADVEYFEFPGCGHGSWNPAFSRDDFMQWLFKQKKPRKYLK